MRFLKIYDFRKKSFRAKVRDSGTAFLYRMPAGIPGGLNRAWTATVEPDVMDPENAAPAYGLALQIGANGVRLIANGDTAVYGILVRPFPLNAQTSNGYFGQQTLADPTVPPASGPCDVLKSGYIGVKVVGQPVAGGPVYVWTSASGGGHVQGGFEAANPNADGFLVAGAYFRGPADDQGNTEIAFNV